MEASPLLAGIPISSRFAEKLGIAQEKQNQQQMTHTRSSTQEDKSWDQTLYEKSDIYRSIKDAYTAPIRAWRGEIDPYSDEGVMEAINLAGVGLTGSIPGGSTGPGTMNLIRGQKVFRFTDTGGTEIIPGLGRVLKEITPDLKNISRRFADPGEELGMHVGTDRSAAEHISREKRGFVDEKGILTMASKVEKPYWVEDTGGSWNPTQTVEALLNRVGPNLDSMRNKGNLSKSAKEQLIEISNRYLDYKNAWDKEDGVLSSIAKPGMSQSDYVAALDTKYNKQIQEILKKEGFDHISYINTREGNPVESAILFDRKDVDFIGQGKNKPKISVREIENMLEALGTGKNKPKEGLTEISSPIQDLEASVQEQVKQLDNTGWKRLPGAAGKRDSDVQPSVIEKLIKQHPDLIKSNPSMVEKYEIYLRNVKKLPEEEIEKIIMPLWSTYLKDGVKKTTEADPLLTAVEKLAGMIEGMNKPKTVIRDKDGRITGVA